VPTKWKADFFPDLEFVEYIDNDRQNSRRRICIQAIARVICDQDSIENVSENIRKLETGGLSGIRDSATQ
jgi:hypothetical protein